MERPRAHSVMQIRQTQSTFHVRASKLLQKVSAKFGGRAPGADSGSSANSAYDGPYMRGTYSMDGPGVAKPYMSQPMLGLTLTRVEDTGADSDGSASPERDEDLAHARQAVNANPSPAARPPPPSRAPPPPPAVLVNGNTAPSPIGANAPLNANASVLSNSVSMPLHATPKADDNAASAHPPRRDSLPHPLRRAHSQNLAESNRKWSRPSSSAGTPTPVRVAGTDDTTATPSSSAAQVAPSRAPPPASSSSPSSLPRTAASSSSSGLYSNASPNNRPAPTPPSSSSSTIPPPSAASASSRPTAAPIPQPQTHASAHTQPRAAPRQGARSALCRHYTGMGARLRCMEVGTR
ncbi:hypothetical protein C8R43DRAFT_388887 [Mycena crocata]|nr:hypothetical protein C8R43DRAFT_388887 [Mycena crocata]